MVIQKYIYIIGSRDEQIYPRDKINTETCISRVRYKYHHLALTIIKIWAMIRSSIVKALHCSFNAKLLLLWDEKRHRVKLGPIRA